MKPPVNAVNAIIWKAGSRYGAGNKYASMPAGIKPARAMHHPAGSPTIVDRQLALADVTRDSAPLIPNSHTRTTASTAATNGNRMMKTTQCPMKLGNATFASGTLTTPCPSSPRPPVAAPPKETVRAAGWKHKFYSKHNTIKRHPAERAQRVVGAGNSSPFVGAAPCAATLPVCHVGQMPADSKRGRG